MDRRTPFAAPKRPFAQAAGKSYEGSAIDRTFRSVGVGGYPSVTGTLPPGRRVTRGDGEIIFDAVLFKSVRLEEELPVRVAEM